MSKKLLLVDDDQLILESLTYSFKKEGYTIISTGDGLEAVSLEQQNQPDLVVLDLMLPSLDGLEVCRRIRQSSAVPIIMLTAKGDEFDRILGLEIGADDYLPKPFSFRELLARVKANLRRVNYERQATPSTPLQIGAVQVDTKAHTVYKGETSLSLTQKEYDLLLTLMQRAGEVVGRSDLLDLVWGVDWIGDPRTLDVHIRWLREKIEENPSQPHYIQTVRGVGYRFTAPGTPPSESGE
jgi:DNA-binding response OmpR family regulator